MRAAVRLAAAAGLLACVACSAAPRTGSEEDWMEYLEVARRLEAAGAALEPGSPEESAAIERFEGLLADFKAPDFRQRVREVYAADAFFNDTLKTARGAGEIEQHLTATADALASGTVEFIDLAAADGNYYFRWEMAVRFRKIARGEEVRSVGMTHVRFDRDGKVVLHQDFWDSTGGLFERLPALGWMLRRVKKRL